MYRWILEWLSLPAEFARPEWRVLCAALTAFVLACVAGRPLIRKLRKLQFLDAPEKGDSEELDRRHAHKKSTPTLGGVLIVGVAALATILWGDFGSRTISICLFGLLAFSAIGLTDDLVQVRTSKKGLSARLKFLLQLAVAAVVAVAVFLDPPELVVGALAGDMGPSLFVPYVGIHVPLGWMFIPLAMLVMTGSSNAVNLTDGLDGLAAGCSGLVVAVFVVLGLASASATTAVELGIPHLAEAGEAAVFAAALGGGILGFLWFNCHPAQVFMGDTGALAIGGSLGIIAVLIQQELFLLLVGGVLVAEVLSVILQVFSYKMWRKRIFLIAPLHHHFQFKGWRETQVTVRFWLAGAILATGSVALLRITQIAT